MKHPVNNERGAVTLIFSAAIGVSLVTILGLAGNHVVTVAKEAYRVKEAYRYLSVVESMGAMLAAAKGRGDIAGPCQAGFGTQTIGGVEFCFAAGATTVAGVCVDSRNSVGQLEQFCLRSLVVSEVEKKRLGERDSMFAHTSMDFRLQPSQPRSFFKRVLDALFLNQSFATEVYDWPLLAQFPGTPGTGSFTPPSSPNSGVTLPPIPATVTAPPSGAGYQATDGTSLATRSNMDPSFPTTLAWTHNNEIRTPLCTDATGTDDWLGCMRCARTDVTCITISVCADSAGACTTPVFTQQIALY